MSKKKIILATAILLLLGAGGYFLLKARRAAIISENICDSNLLLDNPSALELAVILDGDTINVPAFSQVYYPVNTAKFSDGKRRVRSFDRVSGKLLGDTTCTFPGIAGDYVINPSRGRYVCWQMTYFLKHTTYSMSGITVTVPAGGFGSEQQPSLPRVVDETPFYKGYDTLRVFGKLIVEEPVKMTNALVISALNMECPADREVNDQLLLEYLPNDTMQYIYLMSEADFARSYAVINGLTTHEIDKRYLVYLMGLVSHRTRMNDPAARFPAQEFQRPPFGYHYSDYQLDETAELFLSQQAFRNDTAYDDVKRAREAMTKSWLNHNYPPLQHLDRVYYTEVWDGFIFPKSTIVPAEEDVIAQE